MTEMPDAKEATIREAMSGQLSGRMLVFMNQDSSLLDQPAYESELTVPISVVIEAIDNAYSLGALIGSTPPDKGFPTTLVGKAAPRMARMAQMFIAFIAVATKDADDD